MKRLTINILLALCVGLLAGRAAAKVPGANWPQWRGPAGNGVSEATNLPATWSREQNIKWKTPVPGRGHSSPIVWGKHIFLTTAIEGEAIPNAKGPMRVEDYGPTGVHPDGIGVDHKQTDRKSVV